jgi:Mlc titration factor MtfA (ptsG expression regulator)
MIFILFTLIISWLIIYLFNRFAVKEFSAFYHNRVVCKTPIKRGEYLHIHAVLSKYIPYYNNLSENGKARFINRVNKILNEKEFEGRSGLEITYEIKVLLSASATIITFGLEHFDINLLKNFVVFPDVFYSKIMNNWLKGGVTKNGRAMFSLKNYLHGFEFPNDKYNLGLHEMAHALKLNLIDYVGDSDDRFASYFDNWMGIANEEFIKMKEGGESFFRKYASTNKHEFFAVCIEHFFEASEEFQKNLPDIYNHLCILLNQDPLNKSNDYSVEPGFEKRFSNTLKHPLPKSFKMNYRYSSWHWSYSLALVIFLPGIILFGNMVYHTKNSEELIFLCCLLVTISGIIGFYNGLVKTKILSGIFYLWFNIFIFSFPITALALFFNYSIKIKDMPQEKQRFFNYINNEGKRIYIPFENSSYTIKYLGILYLEVEE